MHTRAIPLRDLSLSDEQAWRDLAQRSVEPNPFYEPDFLLSASRHLRGGNRVVLLVAEEAGRFHACLPIRRNQFMVVSLPVVSSWHHMYCFLGTPLIASERAVDALSCILTTLRGRGPVPKAVVFELFGDDGPAAAHLRCAAEKNGVTIHVQDSGERAVFRCQGENANALPTRQRYWRKLRSDLGEPNIVDRAGDRDSSADFLGMEASGWKEKAGTALACRSRDAAFYRDVISHFANSGRLRMYSLEAGGKRLAMVTNLCSNGAMFGWKMAYDERFASYGPGTQLQLRVFDIARREGMHLIDTCSDVGNEHELRLYPDRRRISTFVLSGDGWMRDSGPTLAVAAVKIGNKVSGLSARTVRYRLTRSYVTATKTFSPLAKATSLIRNFNGLPVRRANHKAP